MNKVKLLTWLCIGMLLTNLCLVWFVISHKPNDQKRGGPKKVIIEKLGLDATQIVAYEKLIEGHRTEIKNTEEKMLELKHKLYATLLNDAGQNLKDSLITEIGKSQMAMETIHYKHFSDIKQLCKPNQLKAFEELSLEITNLFPRTRPK
jgi:periplasmic protein CpxP/Spy